MSQMKLYTRPAGESLAEADDSSCGTFEIVAAEDVKPGDVLHARLGCQPGVIILDQRTQTHVRKRSRWGCRVEVVSVGLSKDGRVKIGCQLVAQKYNHYSTKDRMHFTMNVSGILTDHSKPVLRMRKKLVQLSSLP